MNEITLNAKSILKAIAKDGKIEIFCITSGAETEPALLAEILDVTCTRPYLFKGKGESLRLFYTAVHCADEDTEQ
ncbi:MAG: hypothetical protein WCN92_05285, partial [Eubacteriales bacterium]